MTGFVEKQSLVGDGGLLHIYYVVDGIRGITWGRDWNGGGKMKMGNFSHQYLLGNDLVCFES